MVNKSSEAPALLGDLVDLSELHPRVKGVFATEQKVYWFIRSNRGELAGAGALLKFNGRLMIEPTKFAETARAIAARLAAVPPK